MANFKININTSDYELTREIKNLIHNKVNSFERFLPVSKYEEVLADIVLAKTTNHHLNGDIYKAELSLKYKKEIKRGEEVSDNMIFSIEKASEEIIRQIKETKKKKVNLFRSGSKKVKEWLRFKTGPDASSKIEDDLDFSS